MIADKKLNEYLNNRIKLAKFSILKFLFGSD